VSDAASGSAIDAPRFAVLARVTRRAAPARTRLEFERDTEDVSDEQDWVEVEVDEEDADALEEAFDDLEDGDSDL
jgi:hypothetical protein